MEKENKEKSPSSKLIRIILILLVIIIGLVIFLIILLPNNTKGLDCINDSPGDGWYCIYPGDKLPIDKRIALTIKCIGEGGKSETGLGQAGDSYFSCLVAFSDYGKPCNDSDDCKGSCEYTGDIPKFCIEGREKEGLKRVYTCSQEMEGSCTASDPECTWRWKEVDNTKIYQYSFPCVY